MADFWNVPMAGTPTEAAINDEYRRRLDKLAEGTILFQRAAWMANPVLGPAALRAGFSADGVYRGGGLVGTKYARFPINQGVEKLYSQIIAAELYPRYEIVEYNTARNEANPTAPKRTPNWDGQAQLRAWWTQPAASDYFYPAGQSPQAFYRSYKAETGTLVNVWRGEANRRKTECAAWYAAELAKIGKTAPGHAPSGIPKSIFDRMKPALKPLGPKPGDLPGGVKAAGTVGGAPTGKTPPPTGGGNQPAYVPQPQSNTMLLVLGIAAAAGAALLFLGD